MSSSDTKVFLLESQTRTERAESRDNGQFSKENLKLRLEDAESPAHSIHLLITFHAIFFSQRRCA
jgi:hypothetical protein